MAEGFTSSSDFAPRESTVTYPNGDSYSGWLLGPLRHGRGTHRCSNGDSYVGEWAYDLRDGSGTLTLKSSGLRYEGDWVRDKTHGQGRCAYPDGSVYEGEYRDDVRCGWGKMTYANGDAYEGEWEGDLEHGRGTLVTRAVRASGAAEGAPATIFEGAFVRGVRSEGSCRALDGSWEASGSWNALGLNGRGVLVRKGVDKYQGEWRDGEREGWGRCEYAGGGKAAYEGEWLAGERHGRGRLVTEARVYEGEWTKDREEGVGVEVLGDNVGGQLNWDDLPVQRRGPKGRGRAPAGDRAGAGGVENVHSNAQNARAGGTKGGTNSGRKASVVEKDAERKASEEGKDAEQKASMEGKGDGRKPPASSRPSGAVPAPSFSPAALSALLASLQSTLPASLFASPVERYAGHFKAGQRSGPGKCTLADGESYVGTYAEGRRHGRGLCRYANGDVYDGEWARDRREGRGTCRFADGVVFRGAWEDDCWVQSQADAVRSSLRGPGVERARAGTAARFVIEARDEEGNRRLDGGDEFKVLLERKGENAREGGAGGSDAARSEGTLLTGTVTDRDDGTYEVSYIATVAGVYSLVVTDADGEPVGGTPLPVRVYPAEPFPRRCAVRGPGRSRAVAGTETRIEIELRDRFGNLCDADWEECEEGAEGTGSGGASNATAETRGEPRSRAPAGPQPLVLAATLQGNGVDVPIALVSAAPAASPTPSASSTSAGSMGAPAAASGAASGAAPGAASSAAPGAASGAAPGAAPASTSALASSAASAPISPPPGVLWGVYTAPTEGLYRLHVEAVGATLGVGGKPVNAPLPGSPWSVRVEGAAKLQANQTGSNAAHEKEDGSLKGAAPRAGGETPVAAVSSGASPSGAFASARAVESASATSAPPSRPAKTVDWDRVAREAYAAVDGDETGYDSDPSTTAEETTPAARAAEEAAKAAGPGVPVVENLEDMWLVTKLQRERERKEQEEERRKLERVRRELAERYGAPEQVQEEDVRKQLQEVVQKIRERDARLTAAGAPAGAASPSTVGTAGPATPSPTAQSRSATGAGAAAAASPDASDSARQSSGTAAGPAPRKAAPASRAQLRRAMQSLDE